MRQYVVEMREAERLNLIAQELVYGILDGFLHFTKATDLQRLTRTLEDQRPCD